MNNITQSEKELKKKLAIPTNLIIKAINSSRLNINNTHANASYKDGLADGIDLVINYLAKEIKDSKIKTKIVIETIK